MTTPQHILFDLQYEMKGIRRLLEGEHKGEEAEDLYSLVENIKSDINLINNRNKLLEERLDLIIKLLSKN